MRVSEPEISSAMHLPPASRAALQNASVHFISGKGGVGRTTVSVSLARAFADCGYRTLVAEMDEELGGPSPLGLALGLSPESLERDPVEVGARLHAVRLTGTRGQELFLTSLFKMESVARTLLSMDALRKLARVAPSLRELGVFFHLLTFLRKLSAKVGDLGEYDKIVLDLPATGHFLGMTALPDFVLELMPRGPIAHALREGQEILYHSSLTQSWVVTLPESLPVQECLELIAGLEKSRLSVGGVVLNRYPEILLRDPPQDLAEQLSAVEGPGQVAAQRILDAKRAASVLEQNSKVPILRAMEFDQVSSTAKIVSLMTDAWRSHLLQEKNS